MEMGKLTAKLRDAVPVSLLVDGKEIKRYKNIEIPDELKKLEYQDFKFDVQLNGFITFKIMFEPGVLPEEFPQLRERRARKPLAQDVQSQEAATVEDMQAETEQQPQNEQQPQDEQATEALPASEVGAYAQALEDAQVGGRPVEIATAMADGEAIKITENEGEGRLVVITVEPESTEATAQLKSDIPTKKPVRKGKGKKDTASMEDAGK